MSQQLRQSQIEREQQNIQSGMGLIVLGLISLLLAGHTVYRTLTYQPDVVWCGNEIMTRNEECIDFSGKTASGTYEEMRARQERSHASSSYWIIGAGGVGSLLLSSGLVLAIRADRRQKHLLKEE
jgi:hypothetical protein